MKRLLFMGKKESCRAVAQILGVPPEEFKTIDRIEQAQGIRDASLILCHGWEKKFTYQESLRISHFCRAIGMPVLEVDY